MSVIPSQFDLLGNLLDATSLRHKVIAQNIANVNTPGYRRLEVTFEDSLQSEMQSGASGDPVRQKPRIVEGTGTALREDGNNVEVDGEMGRLRKNAILFNVYSQILATRVATMRSAISGH